MANTCCNNTTTTNNGCNNRLSNTGGGFAFVLGLFILGILVGTAWAY